VIFFRDELDYTAPFIHQGITTYVTGNCGFSRPVWRRIPAEPADPE
jgi:N-acyl-D-aspartate/D-glutamate deacylase